MNFKSESTLVEFEEGAENNLNTVIKSLQAVQRRNPNTIVTVGVPVGTNRFAPKPLNAILELNINGTNRLVFTENKSLSHAETLAHAVLKAASIREKSYDIAAAKEASEKHAQGGNDYPYYEGFYRMTIHDACEQIEPESLRLPVYLLLSTNWNDILDWAKDTVKSDYGLEDVLNNVTDSASPK